YLRAYNLVKLNGADDFSVPVKAKDGEIPFIVTKKKEKGRMTYVDLGLGPQLMNIHAGAFRLLANIISI
ncbi:MAG: hypothetical protein ACE5HX_07425, partial [bacterium]